MRVIDLFAGCGGLSLGLDQANFEVLAGVDNWPPSLQVYKINFDHPAIEQDLSNIKETINLLNEFTFDVLAGGPPCQDFSSAGKRDLQGGRADLTYNFAEIVISQKPDFFIMENVERIRKSHILFDIIEDFAEQGYGLTAVLLNASYCGAPQARTRFFLIGRLGEKHNFLLGNLKSRLSPKPMTMRDYFGDKLGIDYYYRHPRNYDRRAIYSMDEPSATIRGVNRPVPPGYKLHSNDPEGIALENVRPLTTDERALVQTFPRKFKWVGSKTAREQMIGNAVPVVLAKFVGEALNDYLLRGALPLEDELDLDFSNQMLIPTRTLDKGIESFVSLQVPKSKLSRKVA